MALGQYIASLNMVSFTDLYKKYNQSHLVNLLFISGICLGYIFLAPSQGCPIDWDCNAYIQMADSIAYQPNLAPHHAMRIFPILLVRALVYIFGLSIPQSFHLISGLSYLLFSLIFYSILNKIITAQTTVLFNIKLYTLAMTLIAISSHHAVIQALVNVYQSTDALTYPIILGLFYCTYFKKNSAWIFLLTLIGIFTRQNLFFMGVFCLLFSLIHHKKIINILSISLYLILSIAAYFLLVQYYHAQHSLLMSITPDANYFSVKNLYFIIVDSGILMLLVPILPLALFVIKEIFSFYFKNWYILLYTGITVGQPLLAYHLTGNNFERIAMQGIWPLYFISALLYYQKYLKNNDNFRISFVLFLYACILLSIMKFVPATAEPLRLNLSIFMTVLLFLLLKIARISKKDSMSAIKYFPSP